MMNFLADITLVTYGGGSILAPIFNAVAMLMNGDNANNFVRPVAATCATLCAAWGVSKVMFSGSMESLLSKYLFPILIIPTLLMIPTTSVKIDDILIPTNSRKIDNVPLLLGSFASLASTASYNITQAIESVLHNVKQPQDGINVASDYQNTGMIFGSESAVDLNRFKIVNGDLENNLRQFSKQCVLYDIALGKYSIDDLKKSTDLWDFFAKNTSNVRMIKYCSPENNENVGNPGKQKCVYKTCKQSIETMRCLLGKEVEYYDKGDILKNLPFAFKALTQISKSQGDIIGQQLMMQMLSNEFNGNSFAKIRAHTHQKSYMNTLGSLAASTIIGTRIAIEALIYASFILIIPLSLLPGGFKFISIWSWLVVWIQMWPPFFAIINYLMLVVAQAKAEALFGLAGISFEKGLSFYTNVGIQNIQDQIFGMGGFLAASVPYITYVFLQGGIHSIGSLAANITTPLSNAASIAASEQATGNYSFANANMGNMSYENEGSFQTNISPSLKSGTIIANDMNDNYTFSPDEWNINQADSTTRMSFSYDEMNARSMNEALSTSQAATQSNELAYTESASSHVRNTANLVEMLSKSESFNNNISQSEAFDIQKCASDNLSIAESYGKSLGINTRDSLDILTSASAGMGIPSWFPFIAEDKISTNYGTTVDGNDALNAALNVVSNSDFRTNMQKIQNFAENNASSSLIDEGKRTAFDYTKSSDDVKSSQDAYRVSLSQTNQLSDNASWLEQVSQNVKYNQTQEFVNWLVDNQKMSYRDFSATTANGSDTERVKLLNHYADFNRQKHPSLIREPTISKYQPPNDMYENSKITVRKVDYNEQEKVIKDTFKQMNHDANLNYGEVAEKRQDLKHTFNRKGDHDIENKLVLQEHNLKISQNEMKNPILKEANKLLLRRMIIHEAYKVAETLSLSNHTDENSFNITQQPFWHKGADKK